MSTITWIGLGHMGAPMSANLVAAGHDVRGFDLSEAAMAAAREGGVQTVSYTHLDVYKRQLLVGTTTFLMGCLPTFHQVGYWATALLVVLRFAQGFAVGGEWGGAILLVAEHSPNRERGFWASWPQAAVPLGNLFATVVLLIPVSYTHLDVYKRQVLRLWL